MGNSNKDQRIAELEKQLVESMKAQTRLEVSLTIMTNRYKHIISAVTDTQL